MSQSRRDKELESLHHQLEEWQHNLALRVAGEAKALDAELHRLTDDEIEELREILRTAQQHVFAGTDMLRDLRRRVQTPLFPLEDQPGRPPES